MATAQSIVPKSPASESSSAPQRVETSSDESSTLTVSADNPVRRVVDEIVALMGDIQHVKEELMARGIPFHTINVLAEFGVQGKLAEQATLKATALETSQNEHGAAAITSLAFDGHLSELVVLEKELAHARHVGRQQGLDMTSINYLTMIIRQNPGDGGEKQINTFLSYALTCDIPVHKAVELAEQAKATPKSVLPDIAREDESDLVSRRRKQLMIDIAIGFSMAVFALALLT